MKPCINEATTMRSSFEDDIRGYAKAGVEAVELWLPKIEAFLEGGKSLVDARTLLDDSGITVAGACCHAGLLLPEAGKRQEGLDQFKRKVEQCKALGAPTLVIPADNVSQPSGQHYMTAARNLGMAADLASLSGVTLALEFLARSSFCSSLETALALVRQAGRANLGVLFDTFHFYMGLSQFDDLDLLAADTLALVHINDCADVLREVATDGQRTLPGQGTFRLADILATFRRIGYSGFVSVELFDEQLQGEPPAEVARKAMDALRTVMDQVTG